MDPHTAPRIIILFPTISLNGAPPAIGIVDATSLQFFDFLREHRGHGVRIALASMSKPQPYFSTPGAEKPDAHRSTPIYSRLTCVTDAWCSFAHSYPDEGFGSESKFHGVEDLATLLELTATNVMDPAADVCLQLCADYENSRPVVIDFRAWYEDIRAHGWFTGTIEEFWSALRDMTVRTEGASLTISLPWHVKVKQLGPAVEYEPFEQDIKFYFRAYIKFGEGEALETVPLSISHFASAFEDAARTVDGLKPANNRRIDD